MEKFTVKESIEIQESHLEHLFGRRERFAIHGVVNTSLEWDIKFTEQTLEELRKQ